MTQNMTNIVTYSEEQGIDVLSALHGEYEETQGVIHVSVLPPASTKRNGPQFGQLYTVTGDLDRQPTRLKHMEFIGQSDVTGAYRFAQRSQAG
jgi:hypothetical protein